MALGSLNWFELGKTYLQGPATSTGPVYINSVDFIHIYYTFIGVDDGLGGNDNILVRFNGETGASYANHVIGYTSSDMLLAPTEFTSPSASGIRISAFQSGLYINQSGSIHIATMPSTGHNLMTIANNTMDTTSLTSTFGIELLGAGDYKASSDISSIEFYTNNGSLLKAKSGFIAWGCSIGL